MVERSIRGGSCVLVAGGHFGCSCGCVGVLQAGCFMNIQQASDSDLMTVKVYRGESGLWAWQCYVYEGETLYSGRGYETEDEAHEAAYDCLQTVY